MQLQAAIPGVEIRLTPNPLRCVTTLTDSARREIVLMLALENVLDTAFSAKFDLENDGRTYRKEDGPKDGKAAALRELDSFLDEWVSDEKRTKFEIFKALARDADYYLDALNEQHAGDCVKIACSCARCHVEELIGVDTRPGDHDGRSYLWDIYAASPEIDPEDIPWRDEQRKRRAEYDEKYGKNTGCFKIDLAKWQPIWDANKAKAVACYEEHKRLYALQQKALGAGRLSHEDAGA